MHTEVFDEYHNRVGVAKALEKIAPSIPVDMVDKLFSFYVGGALRDPKAEVSIFVAVSTMLYENCVHLGDCICVNGVMCVSGISA